MKTLFVGLQYDRDLEKAYLALSKYGLQAAANEFQWNTCDGLIDSLGTLDVITALPVATYPKYKKLYLQKRVWKYRNCSITELPCVNLPLIKQVQRKENCYHEIKEWIHRTPAERHLIILYSLYLPYLQAISQLINEKEEVRALVIVTDLPGKYGVKFSKRLMNWIAGKIGDRAMRYQRDFHGYVLLTDAMKVPLEVGNKPYVVVEGIAKSQNRTSERIRENAVKYILYTGTLNRAFGIESLLNAFDKIQDEKIELWICGVGDAESDVIKRAKGNQRIKYLGFQTKQDVLRLQSEALILVNPRTSEGEYTKYSFPSKTIEYMASGVPVVMHHLAGIPEEYDDYIVFAKDDSSDALYEALNVVIAWTHEQRVRFGKRAQSFIEKQKTPTVQAKKILHLADMCFQMD